MSSMPQDFMFFYVIEVFGLYFFASFFFCVKKGQFVKWRICLGRG